MAALKTPFNPNTNRSERYNDFGSKDGSERSAHYEITHYNGTIRIKSLAFGKYLRRCTISSYDSWIWSDDDSEIDKFNICNHLDSLFKVENLGDNVIALRNLGNNKVCRRLSVNGLSNGLKATEDYADSRARMVVEEPVARRIVKAQYKLSSAKITSRKLTYHSTATGVNKYDNREDDLNFSFTYDKTRTTTWNTTTIVTKNASAEINIPIPKYIDGKIQLSGQTVENRHFEKGSTSSIKTKVEYKIKVPPKTRAIIKGYVQEVTYDIPYSYIQTDTYTTGEQDTIEDENGVCQCVEAYDYYCEKEYIPL